MCRVVFNARYYLLAVDSAETSGGPENKESKNEKFRKKRKYAVDRNPIL